MDHSFYTTKDAKRLAHTWNTYVVVFQIFFAFATAPLFWILVRDAMLDRILMFYLVNGLIFAIFTGQRWLHRDRAFECMLRSDVGEALLAEGDSYARTMKNMAAARVLTEKHAGFNAVRGPDLLAVQDKILREQTLVESAGIRLFTRQQAYLDELRRSAGFKDPNEKTSKKEVAVPAG